MKRTIPFIIILMVGMGGISYAGGDITPVIETTPDNAIAGTTPDSPFYLGLGYSYLQSKRSETLNVPGEIGHGTMLRDTKGTANNVMMQAGYRFGSYLALEARYTLSAGDQTMTDNLNFGYKEDVDIDTSNFALYLKPMYVIDDFLLYGLLGYGRVDEDQNLENRSWNQDGFQWGLGLQYSVGEKLSIFADYAKWYHKKGEKKSTDSTSVDTDFSAISTGISYKF